MNKINVLYKNSQFNKMGFDQDFNENYEFASELAINTLLKKASLATLKLKKSSSKEDLANSKKISKKSESQTKKFTAHPKRFTEESRDGQNEANKQESVLTLDESTRKIKVSKLQVKEKKHKESSKVESHVQFYDQSNSDQDSDASEELSKIPRLVNFDKMKIQTVLKPHKAVSNASVNDISNSEMKLANKHESDVDTGRESLYCSKINSMLIKMSTQLSEIAERMKIGPNPIESIEDQMRRDKKSIEFSARISRNYLYQLSRQIEDLRKNLRPSSSKSSCSNLSVNQKFITAYQVVIQTLQAFCHFLPQACFSRVTGKLMEMLHHISEICKFTKHFRIANNLPGNIGLIEELENTVKEIQTQTDQIACVEEACVSPSISKKDARSCKEPRVHTKKHALESRLSMYVPSVKKSQKGSQLWKKSAASLASKRFSVQSRYKAGIYHPKGVHKPVVHFTEKNVGPKKSCDLKSTPCPSLANEDEIRTMVEMVNNERPETAAISILSAGKQSMGSSTNQNQNQQQKDVQEKDQNDSSKSTNNEVQTKLQPLLENLLTEISTAKNKDEFMNQSNDVLDKLKGLIEQVSFMKREDSKKEVNNDQKSRQNSATNEKRQANNATKKDKSIENVSGPKNAQLICIKDKSCYEESSANNSESRSEDRIANSNMKMNGNLNNVDEQNNALVSEIIHETSSQNITNKQIVVRQLEKPAAEKPKDRLPFGQLSKRVTINIVQYKLDFHKYTKPNHMYRKTPLIQPWILTSRISDKLLDHLLKAIITEIELNNIIERVYKSEFQ